MRNMKKKETAAEKPEKTKKAAEKSEQETQNREKDEDKNKKQKEEYEIINNVKYPKNTNNEFVKQIKEHGKNENDNIELEKKNALNRYRLGEGISDNKNSVSSSVKGAASGAVFGSVSNGAIGKIERNIETKNISKILEKREDCLLNLVIKTLGVLMSIKMISGKGLKKKGKKNIIVVIKVIKIIIINYIELL